MILRSLKLDVCGNTQCSILILYQLLNFGFELHDAFETSDIVGSRLFQTVVARCLKDDASIFPSHRSTYIRLLSDVLVFFSCMSLTKENLSCK